MSTKKYQFRLFCCIFSTQPSPGNIEVDFDSIYHTARSVLEAPTVVQECTVKGRNPTVPCHLASFWSTISSGTTGCGSSSMGSASSAAAANGSATKDAKADVATPAAEAPQTDSRLPFDNFRELFTLKNYWKTVKRNDKDCANKMFAKYLKSNPDVKALYPKLKNVDISTVDAACGDTAFEAVAANYLKVFDDVISAVEEKPGDVQQACDRLTAVGKMHRTKVSGMEASQFQNMEEPFLYMVGDVLQDRFNEKAENLFRKFFQFCLKYLLEGFNK